MHEESTPPRFEIHLRRLLGDTLRGAFPGMVARELDGDTVLVGAIPDQAALHGVLCRIEALGLELLEVRRLRSPGLASDEDHRPEARTAECSHTHEPPPSTHWR